MSFRVLLSGGERRAFEFDDNHWARLKALATQDRAEVRCPPPCGGQLVPKTSHRGTKYFAHRPGAYDCRWAGESDEHLEGKEVIRRVVAARAGWTAKLEHDHGDWQADVLATRGKFQCALEIQLSPQGQALTSEREARYDAAGVLTWWLVNQRNGGDGFGSQLRTIIRGTNSSERLAALPSVVGDVLFRMETQSQMARVVRDHLRRRNLSFQIVKRGGMPARFELQIDGRRQDILLAELGEDAIPGFDALCKGSRDNAWGSVVQFVSHAPHLRGFGSTSFRIDREPLERGVDNVLEKLFRGMVWQAEDAVEAAFIWYREECDGCDRPFARVPFVIAAHRRHWPDHDPQLVKFWALDKEPASHALREFGERISLPTGTISRSWLNGPTVLKEATAQRCPHCGGEALDSRISREEALGWPDTHVDFLLVLPKKRRRWALRSKPPERKARSRDDWDRLLSLKKTPSAVPATTDGVEQIPWFDD